MTVAIVDYGSGNLRSAAKAFERAAREAGTDERVLVTSSPAEVAAADRIVLPGVGAFADCRAGLYAVPGMVEADVPTMAQVLRMATVGGAKTTPFGDSIGTLEVGKQADLAIWDIERPAELVYRMGFNPLHARIHRGIQ